MILPDDGTTIHTICRNTIVLFNTIKEVYLYHYYHLLYFHDTWAYVLLHWPYLPVVCIVSITETFIHFSGCDGASDLPQLCTFNVFQLFLHVDFLCDLPYQHVWSSESVSELGMVVHTCNPSIQEAEARLRWSAQGQYSKTLFQNK